MQALAVGEEEMVGFIVEIVTYRVYLLLFNYADGCMHAWMDVWIDACMDQLTDDNRMTTPDLV